MSKMHVALSYIKALALHRAITIDPGNHELYEELEQVKAKLLEIYSGWGYVD